MSAVQAKSLILSCNMGVFDQSDYDVRCEWGEHGVKTLAPISDVVIIVDILSFSTSVDIATSQGAVVYPYQWKDESIYEYATRVNAEVANRVNPNGYSLAPSTLESLPANFRMVLPSPNGSHLTLLAGAKAVIAGSLRNAQAVSRTAESLGKRVAIVPCGERWHSDESLRPCLEDMIGAGAIIRNPSGKWSPESQAAVSTFNQFASSLRDTIEQCASGKEKFRMNKQRDVVLASRLNVSNGVPILRDKAYRQEGIATGHL